MSRDDEILNKPVRRYLTAPLVDGDLGRRDEQVLEVLAELSSVFRPLAVEIRGCYRDEFGMPQREQPLPTAHILLDANAEGRIVVRPKLANLPPPIVVDDLPAALRQHLSQQPPAPQGLRSDWRTLTVIAAAVRSLSPREELALRGLPDPIQPLEPGWFAGPTGKYGWENTPPFRVTISAEYVDAELETEVYWPPWCLLDTPEGQLLNQALDKLVARGWTEPG